MKDLKLFVCKHDEWIASGKSKWDYITAKNAAGEPIIVFHECFKPLIDLHGVETASEFLRMMRDYPVAFANACGQSPSMVPEGIANLVAVLRGRVDDELLEE